MDIKITEASLLFHVTRQPKTYVGKEMPYVVNTIGKNIERVVPCHGKDPFPLWITKPQQGIIKFIYSAPFQNIECSYSNKHSVLTLHGIRYKNFECANEYVSSIFSMIDTEYEDTPIVMYKAIAKISMRASWDIDVLADVIMNDPEIAHIMAICEKTCTLGNKRLFSIAVSINETSVCRVALTYRNSHVTAMISKLPDEESSIYVADVLERLFEIYADGVSDYSSTPHIHVMASNIETLRSQLPELFVNNYTRECPMLPIMISPEEAESIQHKQRVILYPMNSDKGRYYTALEGYFVGLKRNRLDNKVDFPYLVTCYLHDHMNRTSSDTYKYYHTEQCVSVDETKSRSKRRPLPKAIYDPRYHRKNVNSFISAIESAANVRIKELTWFPQITKQEMWDKSDEEIMDTIRGAKDHSAQHKDTTIKNTSDYDCDMIGLSCVYRYFEELIGLSIHVVVIKEGNFEPLIPRHKGHYIWKPPYSSHIVLFETYKKTYGKESCSYSYLAKGDITLFDETDDVVSYLVLQKSVDSVKPPKILNMVHEQVIDRNGKCKTIITEQGLHINTYTRPLNVQVALEQMCFFDSHIRKMNVVKKEMGIQPIDLSKRSTNSVLYFPNSFSFEYYVSTKKKQSTSEILQR